MDYTQIFLVILGVACTVIGWFASELYRATQALRRDLSALEVRISSEYIRYDRMQDALKPIMDNLQEIKHTLAGKADK